MLLRPARRHTGDEAEGDLARRGRDDRRGWERRSVDHARIMAILAHLDLDAFYRGGRGARAAGAAPQAARRRRRPEGPRSRLDRELRGAPLRDPLGDELRRGAAPLPRGGLRPPPAHALPRVLAGGLGLRPRGRAARRAHRARRGLPRLRPARPPTSPAPAPWPEAVQTSVRATTSLSCSLGVAPTKVVAKVASDRRKPGGITVVPAGTEAAFLAPFAVRALPGVGPRAEERLAAAGVTTIGGLAALSDLDLRALLPGPGRPDAPRPRARHRRTPARDDERADLDLGRGDLRARPARPRPPARRAAPHGGPTRRAPAPPRSRGDAPSPRSCGTATSRSAAAPTSLDVGIDDPERIGELACALLDRGLRDRPGALRLVGVGVSGLSDYRQLSLDETG